MTKPATFTQAAVRRAIKAAESAGLRVTGITADGTVLTAPAGEPAAEPVEDPFVLGARKARELDEKHRADMQAAYGKSPHKS